MGRALPRVGRPRAPTRTSSTPTSPRAERVPVDTELPEPQSAAAAVEERWRRALADLDNLRKRYARQLAVEQAVERARVAAAWLPVVDNLELALEHAGADG